MVKLDNKFFQRDAEVVAKELLGKILVRKINKKEMRAKIVETEAYYDEQDPASRACQKGDLRDTMMMEAGRILVYGVHNNWLINFVTDKEKKASAVLLRAVEPMNFKAKASGPGLLTKSLNINKNFHKKFLGKGLWVEDNREKFDIAESFRVGVKKDLPKKLRFFIKNSPFVSR